LFVPALAALSLLAWSFSGTAALAGEKKADDTELKKESDDLKVEGELTADDPKDKKLKNSPVKSYDFKMKANTVYVIDLKSKAFDAFLRLENPDGKQVAEDDDSGGGLDSRIVYKAPKDGTYKIHATSLDAKAGSFVLTARKGTAKELAAAPASHADLIGKQAPEITAAATVQGKAKKLSDLKGKVVLVDFWAVWCCPCIATFPHLRDWQKELGGDGFEILGVTTYYEQFGFDKTTGKLRKADDKLTADQEHDMLKDFIGHHKLKHQIVTLSRDNWGTVGAAYGVKGIPQAVLVDPKGNVRMIKVGSGPANAKALEAEIRDLLKEGGNKEKDTEKDK